MKFKILSVSDCYNRKCKKIVYCYLTYCIIFKYNLFYFKIKINKYKNPINIIHLVKFYSFKLTLFLF